MINSAYQIVKEAVECSNYSFFNNDSKPYNINIVGFRDESSVNSFNDLFTVSWKYKGIENCLVFHCTTDPGLYYLNNPINVNGTAIMVYGQQKGIWGNGLHKNKYPALVQIKEVSVYRDRNKDGKIDTNSPVQKGWFGINCHRALENSLTEEVNKFSAGCQVFAHGSDHDLFMKITEESALHWGNSFSYTILPINLIR